MVEHYKQVIKNALRVITMKNTHNQSKHLKVACTENFTQEVEGEELSKPVKFRKKCKSYSEQEAERFAEHVSKAARKV